jgi:hydroxymethylpyrimidine pyrophosphatase-like HAD family hydrolase
MNIPRATNPNQAAMFDIDDTLIDSSDHTRMENVYALYKSLQTKGYKMVIITARPGYYENVVYTQEQLKSHNIYYDELVFTPPLGKSIYKKNSKYDYIVSVGDMDTDLTDSTYAVKISK